MNNLKEWWNNLTDDLENDPEYKAESISIDLAIQINEKMEEKKISQSELAKKLQVSKAYISQILQGKNNMTLLTICKIGTALNLDTKVLFQDIKSRKGNIIPWRYINAADVTLQRPDEQIIDSENTNPERDNRTNYCATV